MNKWGSGERNNSKACRNTRRLAIMPITSPDKSGRIEIPEDPDIYEVANIGVLKLPVTSVRSYAQYVRGVASVIQRPPYAVVTKIYLKNHPRYQYEVKFEAVGPLPDTLMEVVTRRREEARSLVEEPYNMDLGAPDEDTGGKRKYD